jgi:hypothetical protein
LRGSCEYEDQVPRAGNSCLSSPVVSVEVERVGTRIGVEPRAGSERFLRVSRWFAGDVSDRCRGGKRASTRCVRPPTNLNSSLTRALNSDARPCRRQYCISAL